MVLASAVLNEALADILLGANGNYQDHSIIFRTGTPPSSINDSATGTLLLTLDIGHEWGTFNNTSLITMDDPIADDTVASGLATYWRLLADFSGSPVALMQGNVGTSGSGASIQFNDVDWPDAEEISLDAFSIQLPPITSA